MNAKTENYIISRKKEIGAIKGRICQLLGWDEFQYGNFIYESGLAFIQQYYKVPLLIQCAERSKWFWDWWKVVWVNQDENMLTFVFSTRFDKERILSLYADLHNVDPMIREAYPPAIVWKDIDNLKKQLICK